MTAPRFVALIIALSMIATFAYISKCTGVFAGVSRPSENCRLIEKEIRAIDKGASQR